MIFEEKEYVIDDKKVILRSAKPSDAETMITYLKTVCGETRFLMCESDEIQYTLPEEIEFINSHNESKEAMLILAFVDGNYAGNCSFEGKVGSRRVKHRAGIGIALYQKYTGFGLGRLMLKCLLKEIKNAGYEQAELTLVESNDRAYRLYQSLGFNECGRISHANKYDDGTYGGEILMVKNL